MSTIKKITLIGCALTASYILIKWAMPKYVEIDMQISEPLPDGDYIVGHSSTPKRIKIKNNKIYTIK